MKILWPRERREAVTDAGTWLTIQRHSFLSPFFANQERAMGACSYVALFSFLASTSSTRKIRSASFRARCSSPEGSVIISSALSKIA
jgi:hypothetical protein